SRLCRLAGYAQGVTAPPGATSGTTAENLVGGVTKRSAPPTAPFSGVLPGGIPFWRVTGVGGRDSFTRRGGELAFAALGGAVPCSRVPWRSCSVSYFGIACVTHRHGKPSYITIMSTEDAFSNTTDVLLVRDVDNHIDLDFEKKFKNHTRL